MLGQRPDGFGYLNKPEENKKVLVQIEGKTFFRTGDKGYISESGHLFLTGRYKRLMKRPDGHQVSPIPIENAICKLPFVQECAVVGVKKGKNNMPFVEGVVICDEQMATGFFAYLDCVGEYRI